jgi:hypothetical protein
LVELTEGVIIPVFTEGVLREVSAVPEEYAAAWFTETTQFMNEEVTKMLDKRAKEALVKLFDGDESAADKWLEENVDPKNRLITERQLITRETDEVVEPIAEVTQEVEPVQPAEIPTLEIDDSVLDAIITQLATRQGGAIDEAIAPLKDAIKSLDDRVSALEKAAGGGGGEGEGEGTETPMEDLLDRINSLEAKFEKDRTKTWYEDLPVKSTLRVTHRPRENVSVEEVAPVKPETFADVADATLQSMEALKSKY